MLLAVAARRRVRGGRAAVVMQTQARKLEELLGRDGWRIATQCQRPSTAGLGCINDAMHDDVAAEAVLSYWFGDLDGPYDVDRSKNSLWWGGGDTIDAEIKERFGDQVRRAKAGELEGWLDQPRTALALVILLDQFTRNVGRGTAEAFSGDVDALRVSLEAQSRGHDKKLRPIERGFLYMPMMHSEDAEIAERSVETFGALSRDLKELGRDDQPDFYEFAVSHADIVRRFGRYPHRNEIIGRESTSEEIQFLEDGGPSFGQTKKG